MSAVLSALQPARRREQTPDRHLRPLDLPQRRRRPRLAYAITAVAGVVVIGLAQLILSMATTQTTYEIRALTQEQRELTLQAQALNDEVAGLTSPQYLANSAVALGMVAGADPTYLRLSDGALIGQGTTTHVSNINPGGGANVPNALLDDTPLATAPAEESAGETATEAPAPELPPVITDGLPTPETH